MAGYALVAQVVDPRGDFGGQWFPKVLYDARAQKQALFKEYLARGPVEGLVLGSSRVMKLRPVELQKLTGYRFFNFSVDLGRGDDFVAVYRWVRRQAAPKVVVIGLDTEALASDEKRHWKLDKNTELVAMLEPGREGDGSGVGQWVTRHKETLTLAYVGDMLLSLRLSLRPHENMLNAAFDPDGYLRYPRWEAARARGTFDLDHEIQTCLAGQLKLFSAVATARPGRMAEFERLVQEAHADGARVKVFLTGLHPTTVRFLTAKGAAYEEQTALNRTFASGLHRRFGAEIYDFSELPRYDGTPTGWYDCAHVDEVNATLIARALMRASS